MPRQQITDILEELRSWLPNYDSQNPNSYPVLLFRILGSLPGGDDLEGMGYGTFEIGWHESDQLARVIDAIQDKQDVEDLVQGLLYDEEADELDESKANASPAVKAPISEEWWIIWDGGEPEGPFEKKEDAEGWAHAEGARSGRTYAIQRCDPAHRPHKQPKKKAPRKKAPRRKAPRKKTRKGRRR